jgi:tRNA uridine 5-carbamoylmethylation protein Kti12
MESRIRSLEYLTSILQDHNSGIMIVDDLMYYRSMRKEIYRIGTKYQAHLVVIHIDTPLEIALRRNRDRHEASRIPDEVRSFFRILLHSDF